MSLREQRGEDDPSYPRQGARDWRVALLGLLPRLGPRSGELADQDINGPLNALDLAVHKVRPLSDRGDVSSGRVCCGELHLRRVG
ncbi:hypothetical protein [Acidisoma sp. L85]|uniref:hypothetical protein n=1 Tax=Acidisoma sp. L85 TaxID=1641850 RepID=UPI00131CB25C|nr:hypothetical protein [Acidisoma sp. L85]